MSVAFNSRRRLVGALVALLDTRQSQPLTMWQARCLSEAMALARYSRFERALQCLEEMKRPGGDVVPVKRMPTPQDVRQTILHISKGHESLAAVEAFLATLPPSAPRERARLDQNRISTGHVAGPGAEIDGGTEDKGAFGKIIPLRKP